MKDELSSPKARTPMCAMWESLVTGSCSSEQLTSSTNWTSSSRRGWEPPTQLLRNLLVWACPWNRGERTPRATCKVCKHLNCWHRAEMSMGEKLELPHMKPETRTGSEGTIQSHVCLQPWSMGYIYIFCSFRLGLTYFVKGQGKRKSLWIVNFHAPSKNLLIPHST